MTTLIDGLAELLRLTRNAEADVFGSLDPVVRETPIRQDDWTPKDFQAHLTAWKARQANRVSAARRGVDPDPGPPGETDEINAAYRAARVDWSWDDIASEADEVNERLIAEITASDPDAIPEFGQLIATTLGNGPFHALPHFAWLLDAGVPIDAARVERFASELGEMLPTVELPDVDAGTALYNLACYHSLAGRLDEARSLLHQAFAKRPDLGEYSLQDDDLKPLRDELPALAGSSGG
ncbi:MAG TPA: tetratricopeptide repeat protein [Candidatus Limnocylindria bacterium]